MRETHYPGPNGLQVMRERRPLSGDVYEFTCHVCQRSWVGQTSDFMWDHRDSLKDWFIWKLPQIDTFDADLAEHIRTLLYLIAKYGLEEMEQFEEIKRNPNLL